MAGMSGQVSVPRAVAGSKAFCMSVSTARIPLVGLTSIFYYWLLCIFGICSLICLHAYV